ncbi:DUF6753 family protein [Tolypothrix sp. VBCCA 56010]|uniref:DUF6753 family protein n=1 Tax=Tolypothrix sp. VBCCA 56010 TaxID=3137731 RepID=UPI003D7E03D6
MMESEFELEGEKSVNKSRLDAAFEGYGDEFKGKVLDIVTKTGLEPDDPLFLVLAATGRLEVLLEDAPDTLGQLFKNWSRELARNLELVESATVERQKLAISKAAGELIRKAQISEGQRLLASLVPTAGLLLAILGVGFIMDMSIPPWLAGGFDPTGPRHLTLSQAETLRWAESGEGKFARNLMQWNRGYLDNKSCVKDVQRLKVVLNLDNRRAKSGFCLVWVVPADKREFEK